MTGTRKQRLESLLRREIATCLHRDVRDPRLTMITVTRVEVTGDLQQATAFYTVLGGEGDRRTVARALADARPFVQGSYAPAVRLRHLPILRFAYDDQEKRRLDMDELIRHARSTDPNHTGIDTPDPGGPTEGD